MSIKNLPADARPREKLLARGPGALSDTELLALLLRTGIQGKGVMQLADELLHIHQPQGRSVPTTSENTLTPDNVPIPRPPPGFDGLAGLLQASADDLKRIKGLGPAKRAELVAVLELARRAMAQTLQTRSVLDSPEAMSHYLQLQLAGRGHEVFCVLFLDAQHRLLALEELFRGTLTQTSVYPREVVLRALHHQAAAVVLAHNHPSGNAQPSKADEALTRVLASALMLLDIRVLDHIVVAPGSSFSFLQHGLL